MSTTGAIIEELKANPAVSAWLGASGGVYRGTVRSSAGYPRIIVTQTSGGEHIHHMDGMSGLARSTHQIEVIANDDIDEADEGAETVRLALLSSPRRTMGTPPNTAAVRGMTLSMPMDMFGSPRAGSDEFKPQKVITTEEWSTETTA